MAYPLPMAGLLAVELYHLHGKPGISYGYSVAPTLSLLLLAVWWLLYYFAAPRASWLAGADVAIGVATLFRHDFGFCAFASAAVMLALFQ